MIRSRPSRLTARLVVLLPLAFGAFFARTVRAGDLPASLRELRTSSSVEDLRERLVTVGFSRTAIEKAAASQSPRGSSLFSTAALKRAESWSVNLDPDRESESVIQVWFQSEAENMQFEAVYLILVLDAEEQGKKVLGEYVFELDGCDYSSEKTLTLAFGGAPRKTFQEVRFNVNEATSCGTLVEITSRRDVLSWNVKLGRLDLVRGKQKTSRMDRLELVQP